MSNKGIATYEIAPATGQLRRLLLASPDVGVDPNQYNVQGRLVADPLGRFLFVLSDGHVHGFAVAADGGLVPTPGSPFRVSTWDAFQMAVDPKGQTAYIVTGIGRLDVRAISSSGTLTSATSVYIPNGDWIAVDPLNRFVFDGERRRYSGHEHLNSLLVYAIGPQGLVPVTAARGEGESIAAVDPQGRFIYMGGGWISPDGTASLLGFRIQPDGAPVPIPGSPFTLTDRGTWDSWAIEPTGRFMYSAGGVAAAIDPDTGALSRLRNSPHRRGPEVPGRPVVIDPLGFLYVGNQRGIEAFAIDAATGDLTAVDGSAFEAEPPFALAAAVARAIP
jgi:hypothetical protein